MAKAEMEPRGAACGFSARLGWPLVLLNIAPVRLAASWISQLPVPGGSSGCGHSPILSAQAHAQGRDPTLFLGSLATLASTEGSLRL